MIVNLEDLRAALTAERKRRGIKQQELAWLIGMTPKWLSQFENGHTNPPASTVIRLARMLGFTFEPPKPFIDTDEIEQDLLDRGV
jgi:transcriptional regulator with XRE-family HTH domain